MKILLIHDLVWTHYKIAVFNELYKLCKKQNIKFKVIHIALTAKQRKNLGNPNLKEIKHPYKILFKKSIDKISKIQRIKKIIKEIREFSPDWIINEGYAYSYHWATLYTAKKNNIKLATIVNSTEQDKKRRILKEKLKSIFVKNSDIVFCYGEKSKAYSKKLGAKKIYISNQATDNKKIINQYKKYKQEKENIRKKYNLQKNNIIYIGRLSKEKNIPTLIKAFSQLNQTNYNLIILGSGPEESKLKKLTKKLNLKNIRFIPGVNWKEVPKFLVISDLMILPSTSEPWGLVTNEAMLCKVPVLVSNFCGCTEMLNKEQIFNPNNINELKNKIKKILNNEKLKQKLIKNQAKTIKKYTPKNAAKGMINAIKTHNPLRSTKEIQPN